MKKFFVAQEEEEGHFIIIIIVVIILLLPFFFWCEGLFIVKLHGSLSLTRRKADYFLKARIIG